MWNISAVFIGRRGRFSYDFIVKNKLKTGYGLTNLNFIANIIFLKPFLIMTDGV